MQGIIAIWSGAIVDIPGGWYLCDGSNDTPDLRDRFVLGASATQPPGTMGGSATHTHSFTLNNHTHTITGVGDLGAGTDYGLTTTSSGGSGTTGTGSNYPPYYALAYIIKSL